MTMPRMEAAQVKIDRSFWHPMGMESSESYGIDFTGACVGEDELIGRPGDFYRDPLFRGGAVRFAAVQAGAAMRLHAMFTDWLHRMGREGDPYQLARLGEVAMLAQEAALWVEKAGAVAEECLLREDEARRERMVECANMMRLAIERLSTRMMQMVTAGVGAHGLLQPARFERVIRDLTMYLRQPAPDQTLADVGRASLRKAEKARDGVADGFWSEGWDESSLPPEYFRRIYERNADPWQFETSGYEAGKYKETMASLPRERYERGVEIGCSIGVLTEQLAGRCEELLGWMCPSGRWRRRGIGWRGRMWSFRRCSFRWRLRRGSSTWWCCRRWRTTGRWRTWSGRRTGYRRCRARGGRCCWCIGRRG